MAVGKTVVRAAHSGAPSCSQRIRSWVSSSLTAVLREIQEATDRGRLVALPVSGFPSLSHLSLLVFSSHSRLSSFIAAQLSLSTQISFKHMHFPHCFSSLSLTHTHVHAYTHTHAAEALRNFEEQVKAKYCLSLNASPIYPCKLKMYIRSIFSHKAFLQTLCFNVYCCIYIKMHHKVW